MNLCHHISLRLQVQGLVDLLSGHNLRSAATLTGLSDLHHDKQEAVLIDKLRQQAVKAIIEAAYGVRRADTSGNINSLNCGLGIPASSYTIIQDLPKKKPRELDLSTVVMPENLPFWPTECPSISIGGVTSGEQFFFQYMEVIKFDLGNFGYTVTHHSHNPIGKIALSSKVPGNLTSATLTHGLAAAGLAIQTEVC